MTPGPQPAWAHKRAHPTTLMKIATLRHLPQRIDEIQFQSRPLLPL
ncbi:hypothetical protein NTGHW29_60006 [Candidatus Nitrotoga sp. HW29]|nr:hypothetical protein NTGHW29_60006 [Candidatus Nitrotoga sp. HW29]